MYVRLENPQIDFGVRITRFALFLETINGALDHESLVNCAYAAYGCVSALTGYRDVGSKTSAAPMSYG